MNCLKKSIQIDDLPHNLFTFSANDYSAKTILSSLYEPLFYEKSGEYKSLFVNDTYKDNLIKLKFSKIFWSNGELLTANDMYKTLIYILKEKTIFSSYLDFIVGVEEYLYENETLEDVKITEKNNTLFIETKYNYDYKKLLSSIQFSPVYFINNNPTNRVSNGRFYFDGQYENVIKVKANPFFISLTNQKKQKTNELHFIHLENLTDGPHYFHEKQIDMTCSTYFPFHLISEFENTEIYFEKKSNILFMIEISESLMPIKEQLKKYVYDELRKNPLLNKGLNFSYNYFFDNSYQKNIIENTILQDKLFKDIDKLDLLFAEYYPNNLIVSSISNFFLKHKVSIRKSPKSLKDFTKEYFSKRFDVCLKLVSPLINTEMELLLSYLNTLPTDELQDTYVDLVNNYLNANTYKNKEIINTFLEEYSTVIPLCTGKHLYLKNDQLKDFYIDENDLYKFLDLT